MLKKEMEFGHIIVTCIVLLLAATLIFGVSFITSDVSGANITNASVSTKVYVWNTEPDLYSVTISPNPIDLTPGNITQVNCTGKFYDYNGWQDAINTSINATLYDLSGGYGPNSANDNNNHYSNSSCRGSCSEIGSSGTNGTCSCSFNLQYYANNATWQCSMSIIGGPGNATTRQYQNFSDSMNGTATVTKLLALTTPSEINFGNLSVTETSNDIQENITNWGNTAMNISLRGYGGDVDNNNVSMLCNLGNISNTYMRYSAVNNTSFDSMYNISNVSSPINGFTIAIRTDDNSLGNSINSTYWKLQIPLSIGGNCNGTVIFSASDAY